MPNAATTSSKTNAPNDAPSTTVVAHDEPAVLSPKPRETDLREPADDPYDNLACTD